ncbi:MAG: hypothetical protein KIT31_04765 [Deltaproteobacteria bacterium]|nr:hypothetical protein [Deltaproteobacteria bacterium]
MAHVRDEASGELVCASSRVEIHVYLQRGRIAWATDSTHPFAFAAHLQKHAGIDPDTFRQVVEECRRGRMPLGETLVEWGLAGWETVRTSLAHQISLAIALLAGLETSQVIFLARVYETFDARLTFDLRDVAGGEVASPPAPAARPQPDAGPSGLARQLRGSVEGLSWVEAFDGERLAESDPPIAVPRVPLEVARATLLDGADFAAIRSVRTSLVGFAVAPPRSIWCHVAAGSTFGAVVSSLWAIAEATGRRSPAEPRGRTSWSVGPADAPRATAIHAFAQRATEMAGALVLSRDGEPIAGSGATTASRDACVDVARRRVRCLQVDLGAPGDEVERSLDAIGFSMRTMVSGEPGLWCFGAELDPRRGETLWMLLERHCLQGLGWAYLAALTRTLRKVQP